MERNSRRKTKAKRPDHRRGREEDFQKPKFSTKKYQRRIT